MGAPIPIILTSTLSTTLIFKSIYTSPLTRITHASITWLIRSRSDVVAANRSCCAKGTDFDLAGGQGAGEGECRNDGVDGEGCETIAHVGEIFCGWRVKTWCGDFTVWLLLVGMSWLRSCRLGFCELLRVLGS